MTTMTGLTDASFYKILVDKFPHTPTPKQSVALQKLASFVFDKNDTVFMLKGFAGTGKTTLIGTLVNSLWKTTQKAVMMAPTGRAAKVMGNYSKSQAFTIHRKIYFPKNREPEVFNLYWPLTNIETPCSL